MSGNPLLLSALVCLSLLWALGTKVEAREVVASCGASKGQTYYFEGGLVGPGRGGWLNDGSDGGRIQVEINDKGDLDLLVKDQIKLRSYLTDGYRVVPLEVNKEQGAILIAAYGDNWIETYVFKLNQYGIGTVAWSTAKVTSPITKGSLMIAECAPQFAINKP